MATVDTPATIKVKRSEKQPKTPATTPPTDGLSKRVEVKMTYSWRPGSCHKVSAEVAAREIDRIKQATGTDTLTPDQLVEESRSPASPLHPEFEWDDSVAGEEFRKHQARNVINSVRVSIEAPDETNVAVVKVTPAYVSTVSPVVGRCYVATNDAMQDSEMREHTLADAVKLLRGVQARFGHLTELAEISAEIDRLAEMVGLPT